MVADGEAGLSQPAAQGFSGGVDGDFLRIAKLATGGAGEDAVHLATVAPPVASF